MKVLFAVSSESISDAIIKRYQREYKEILSYKNVYYFNAILKEIQKDKTYDRIVISEDLEPFSNSNYDTIDKFIFEKLDNISDEAQDSEGKETSIILICTDRHTKGSSFLVKLFGIGVYNALLGNDRSMETVCKLINKPRVKKEAKMYYKIDADEVNYEAKSDKEVSELEIQNILTHFKKIAKNKDKFADSFNNIATQYTDDQLKIIINCLPINVKAVLEEECPKYQELMSVGGIMQKVARNNISTDEAKERTGIKIDMLENKEQPKMSGPIVVPSAVRKVRAVANSTPKQPASNTAQQGTTQRPVQSGVQRPAGAQPTSKPTVQNANGVQQGTMQRPAQTGVQRPAGAQPASRPTVQNANAVQQGTAQRPAQPGVQRPTGAQTVSRPTVQNANAVQQGTAQRPAQPVNPNAERRTVQSVRPTIGANSVQKVTNTVAKPSVENQTAKTENSKINPSMFFDDSDDSLLLKDETEDVANTNNNEDINSLINNTENEPVKKGRGRPRKYPIPTEPKVKGKRGRPKKVNPEEVVQEDEDDDSLVLDFDENVEDNTMLPGMDDTLEDDMVLPEVGDDDALLLDYDETEEDTMLPGMDDTLEDEIVLPEDGDDDESLSLDYDETEEDTMLPGMDDTLEDEIVLPEIGDDEESLSLDYDETEDTMLPGMDDTLEDDMVLPEIGDDESLSLDYDETKDTMLPGMDDTLEDDMVLPEVGDDDDLSLDYDETADDTMLPGMDESVEDDSILPEMGNDDDLLSLDYDETTDDTMLPGMDDQYEEIVDDGTVLDGNEEYEEVVEDDTLLPGMDDQYEEVIDDGAEFADEEVSIPGLDELDDYQEEDTMLPGMDDNFEQIDDDYMLPNTSNDFGQDMNSTDDDNLLLDFDDNIDNSNSDFGGADLGGYDMNNSQDFSGVNNYSNNNAVESIKPQVDYSMSNLNSLLTKDKKIVTFLGTTKNGTSFLVNNLAALFSSLGINTAILDMTRNRNSYYIYTKNEEELRKIAYDSIENLQEGNARGIKVDKNLSVYTALPNDGKDYSNAEPILSTLVQNHSLILIDCDFETDPSYFASCQEIYLVQSMDILTIQPLTSFLRDLKAKGVLESEKVRVVVNKEIKIRTISSKDIIAGMSFYNDPAMSFMTELFNKEMVKACSIPFEDNAYAKYLDAMVNCNVSIKDYSKAFLTKLKILGDMVYPLTSKQTYGKPPSQGYQNKNAFSNNINNTLNQMKKKY